MSSKKSQKSFIKKIIPLKGDSITEIIRKVSVLVASAVLIVCLFLLASDAIDKIRTKKLIEEQQAQHTETVIITEETTAPETEVSVSETEPPPLVVLPQMQSFVDDNPDTAGWIKVDNTQIDNVVVQAEDNNYYLDKDFNGNKAQAGTIYIDYRCIANDYDKNQSDNIIIYGHNQKNGTMFGTLKDYKITQSRTENFDFYCENPTFTFSNLYEEYTYKIIAMFIIEVEPRQTRDGVIFDYHNYINFTPNRSFDTWKSNILDRTAVNTGVDFNEDDQFITLSTCSNEFEPSRFVVIGRKVRDGESSRVDTSKAELNTDAKEPDLNFIYS